MTEHCKAGLHIREGLECIECGQVVSVYEDRRLMEENEPPPASVVLTEGPTGTAWQRFHGDGSWHSTTGRVATWGGLMKSYRAAAPVRIVYLPSPTPTR